MTNQPFPPEVPKVGNKIRISTSKKVVETVVLRRDGSENGCIIYFPKMSHNPHSNGDNIGYASFAKGGWIDVFGQIVVGDPDFSLVVID